MWGHFLLTQTAKYNSKVQRRSTSLLKEQWEFNETFFIHQFQEMYPLVYFRRLQVTGIIQQMKTPVILFHLLHLLKNSYQTQSITVIADILHV